MVKKKTYFGIRLTDAILGILISIILLAIGGSLSSKEWNLLFLGETGSWVAGIVFLTIGALKLASSITQLTTRKK